MAVSSPGDLPEPGYVVEDGEHADGQDVEAGASTSVIEKTE